jgi:membrane fusion protein (multidrug efflux system)
MNSVRPFTAAIAFLLAACSAGDDSTRPEEAPPIPIRVANVLPTESADTFRAVGTVRLRREIDLGFTTPGRIATIAVEAGDRVRKGQLLAALDTTTVGADLAAAAAERTRTQADLARARDLFAKGWVTRARLDSAEAAYRAAAAATTSAQFSATTARIVAPADGHILRRMAEVSQVVNAGTPVISFGDNRDGFVLRVPITDVQASGIIRTGSVPIDIAALGPAPLAARIVEVAGRADDRTGTFAIVLALPPDPALRSGQIGHATLSMRGSGPDTMLVPSSAVFAARAGEAFVYVLDASGKRVKHRRIVTGQTNDQGVAVLEGLKAGERIAVTGISQLADGSRVTAAAPGP